MSAEKAANLPEIVDGKLSIEHIKADHTHLRGVQRESPDYVELRENIRTLGVKNAVTVAADPANGCYQLIDGLQRFSAVSDIVAETGEQMLIPVHVDGEIDLTNKVSLLIQQMASNKNRVNSRPAEFAKACVAIMEADRSLTVEDLATKTGQSSQWLGKILGLRKLTDTAAKLVDEGNITLVNALALAQLPEAEQDGYLAEAQTEDGAAFGEKMSAAKKALRDEAKSGGKPEFVPTPTLRKKDEVLAALKDNGIQSTIAADAGSIAEAVTNTLNWMLSLDAPTVAVKKSKWDADQKRREEQRAARNATKEVTSDITSMLKELSPEELEAIRKEAAEKLQAREQAIG